MSAKVCAHCHQDCSNKPRVKDPGGQYYCKECYPAAQAAAKSAGVGASDGATFGVFDEPIIPTADIVAPKEDAKQTQKRTQEKNAELPPKNCQNCGIQMPATGIVCTNCGFNTTSGKALKTKIEKAKVIKEKKASSGGTDLSAETIGVWSAGIATLIVWGMAIYGLVMNDTTVIGAAFLACYGFAFLASIFTLIAAFMTSVVDGLLTWFLPFYVLFFIFARCESLAVKLWFLCSVGSLIGVMILLMSSTQK